MNENAQTINSTPEETGGRLFSQDEVNKIVSDRLAREREKLADDSTYRAKYEALKREYDGMKAAQAYQAKENAYRELLAKAGVSEKRVATVLKVSAAEIDALELDENGKAVGADKLMEAIKSEWADFIETIEVQGAETPFPPMNTSSYDGIAAAFKPKI